MLASLINKEQAAEYLGLKTAEAAEKRLARLGVKKYDFGLVGGKGIRYRLADIDDALSRIVIDPTPPAKKKKPKKHEQNFFTLSVKEQKALLTAGGVTQ
ncbi:MAG: hypothetical protein LBV80_08180 [Deltaproteobacteria bacterium]|jgi:hypothetical protein|nr:hypothetical protein [Deltaproteobacteria bacterium]